MKRILFLAVVALLGLYFTGRIKLGESGAVKYLAHSEALMNDGNADELCDLLHDDLELTLKDHTAKPPKDLEGGKQELCDITHDAVTALGKIPHSMNVQWNDVEVKRSWLHPWTSEVSYTEDRTMSIRGANVRISTTSENTMTLVHTFSGVKMRRIESEVWMAE